ncbi:Uncharacterised protein [Citrobacter koseri]|uniref:Uncharacterized protein n=1 Tax=Citrobacter koseri (strain ATCC BAA-895 / CDC 4225-83 / SGSC4696) TaxID=290338 RepID=A8APK3_CITK8|nr:hypothetical protein CKO_04360 [Citrobacter koseri ATCC BAA-895]MBJ9070411.1 hypothetical protein [Citrobacter koseri]SQB08455.1 Uncharacterised protein [Citrobacter koseri]STB47137.1 Uncharacterised protein [Citrobacter koseri]HEM7989665.1 hypothetical protein [Citrobacter koseri]
MNITRVLLGAQFLRLIHEGKQTDCLIKNGGAALLKQSTPEQENALNLQWFRLSSPNPISIGVIVMLLVASIAWEWTPIIYFFNLPVDTSTILCLSIMPIAGVYSAFIPYGLGRGYTSGLTLIRYFYFFNILLTSITFILTLVQPVEFYEFMRKLSFFSLQLLILYLSRYTINSKSFYRIISFLRTLRLILEAKKEREMLQKK